MGKSAIYIDAGCLAGGRLTGWERYTRAVIEAVSEIPGLTVEVLERPPGISPLRWSLETLPAIMRRRSGLLHCPATPPCPVIRSRTVTTIHDATLLFHPEWGSRGGRVLYGPWMRYQRRSSIAWQLTVSHAARRDLLLAGFRRERVAVASPPGGDLSVVPPVRPRVAGDRFVLFVGTREPRKNIPWLMRAWRQTEGKADTTLVLAGRKGWVREGTFPPDVIVLEEVSDPELAWLYRNAIALVSPSRYEGFGLPVVEAAAMGLPIVASDIPATREVAPPGTRFVPSDDDVALAAELGAALRSGRHGAVPATRYTLQGFAAELERAYLAILEGNREQCGGAGQRSWAKE